MKIFEEKANVAMYILGSPHIQSYTASGTEEPSEGLKMQKPGISARPVRLPKLVKRLFHQEGVRLFPRHARKWHPAQLLHLLISFTNWTGRAMRLAFSITAYAAARIHARVVHQYGWGHSPATEYNAAKTGFTVAGLPAASTWAFSPLVLSV